MKLPVVLAVLIGILVLACSNAPPAPAEPTPNIDATVEARVKQEVAAQPTTTPVVVVKEVVPTDTPAPTDTPVPTTPPNTPIPPRISPTLSPTALPFDPAKQPTSTPKSIPTVTPTPTPTPTATPTPTPFPLTANLSITKAEDFPDYFGENAPVNSNCFDLELTNTNEAAISFHFDLTAFDDYGVQYYGSSYRVNHSGVFAHNLLPGETFHDMRCWSVDRDDWMYFSSAPVTRMEPTLVWVEATEGVPSAASGWDKIGDNSGELEDSIMFLSEPRIFDNYPNWTTDVYPFLYPNGFRPTWQFNNISGTKTLTVKSCVAYRWRDSRHTNKFLTESNLSHKPGAQLDTYCQSTTLAPKTTAKQENNISSGRGGAFGAAQALYDANLYYEILGIWVREE